MTLAELRDAREAAGVAYCAAAEAFVSAWVELHALDRLAERGGLSGGFAVQPSVPGHGVYLRDLPGVLRDPATRAALRLDELAADLEG